jgi:hypothetical protein
VQQARGDTQRRTSDGDGEDERRRTHERRLSKYHPRNGHPEVYRGEGAKL